jgi:uncharacterized protein involved in cysteine biosynthesis
VHPLRDILLSDLRNIVILLNLSQVTLSLNLVRPCVLIGWLWYNDLMLRLAASEQALAKHKLVWKSLKTQKTYIVLR